MDQRVLHGADVRKREFLREPDDLWWPRVLDDDCSFFGGIVEERALNEARRDAAMGQRGSALDQECDVGGKTRRP